MFQFSVLNDPFWSIAVGCQVFCFLSQCHLEFVVQLPAGIPGFLHLRDDFAQFAT